MRSVLAKSRTATFGLTYLPSDSIAETVSSAVLAEKLGFNYFWICDESPSTPFRDPWVTLAAIAGATKKIKLGTSVTNPYTRHPAHTAVAMLSLHELSKGRAGLGYGPGGSLTLPPTGFKLWDTPVRVMRDATRVVRELLEGKTVSFQGEYFKLNNVKIYDKADGGVPIYFGIRGSQMLRLAGEIADGTQIITPGRYLEHAMEQIKRGASRVGRSLRNFDFGGGGTSVVSYDIKKAKQKAKFSLSWSIPDCPDVLLDRAGIKREDADKIADARRRKGTEGAMEFVTDEMVDLMSIAGKPAQVVDKVMDRFKGGITQFIFSPPYGLTYHEGIKLIGREVLPELRDRLGIS